MIITPDVNLFFTQLTEMLAGYIPPLCLFLVIALPARVAIGWIHNALEHKTHF